MSGRIPRRVLISKVQRNSPANNVLMLGGTAGFIGRSRITIGALEDLGYVVNYDESESFTLNNITQPQP